MEFLNSIIADFRLHFWVYISMPIVAAAIGYITKIAAIHMMFFPLEFKGLKPPYLGWQGIIPRRAKQMAEMACDIMTSRLISPVEIFSRLDSARVAKEIERPIMELAEKITHEVMSHYEPQLWETMPLSLRDMLIKRVQQDTPDLVKQIMDQFKNNLNEIFDLKDMVTTNLVRDKLLLNKIFLESGKMEFRFIRNSGFFFGFLIGIVQMLTWIFTKSPLIMPLFGLFTGWFTDWLALRMIFNPKHPVTYFRIFTWQGLFLKRRKEVATAYGTLIAEEILTPSNIISAVLSGPLSDNMFAMIQHHVQRVVDEQSGPFKPLVVFTVGTAKYLEMKNEVSKRIIESLPKTLKYIEQYAEDAMDIRNTLAAKMKELTPEEFESLLRPAFQQDEWILITVGAVLGFLVGEFQVLFMLH